MDEQIDPAGIQLDDLWKEGTLSSEGSGYLSVPSLPFLPSVVGVGGRSLGLGGVAWLSLFALPCPSPPKRQLQPVRTR